MRNKYYDYTIRAAPQFQSKRFIPEQPSRVEMKSNLL